MILWFILFLNFTTSGVLHSIFLRSIHLPQWLVSKVILLHWRVLLQIHLILFLAPINYPLCSIVLLLLVLKFFVRLLERLFRKIDVVIRWTGLIWISHVCFIKFSKKFLRILGLSLVKFNEKKFWVRRIFF